MRKQGGGVRGCEEAGRGCEGVDVSVLWFRLAALNVLAAVT